MVEGGDGAEDLRGAAAAYMAVRELSWRTDGPRREPLPVVVLAGVGDRAPTVLASYKAALIEDGIPRGRWNESPATGRPVATEEVPEPEPSGDDALDAERSKTLAMRRLIGELSRQLATPRTDTAHRLRFRRLWLACLLLGLDVGDHDHDPGEEERRLLKEVRRRRRRWPWRANDQPPSKLDAQWAIATFLLLGVPWLLFRLRASGRLPGQFRWFRKQQQMPTREASSFAAFGIRLTRPDWQDQDQQRVRRLLVDALLADLRYAYRPGWRRPFMRPRMARPVVLVEAGRDEAAADLLRTVAAIRRETGARDPLVLVASVPTVKEADVLFNPGSDAAAGRVKPWSADKARDALAPWRQDRPRNGSETRVPAFRVLEVEAREEPSSTTNLAALQQTAPRAPWWARQVTTVGAAALIVGAATTVCLLWSHSHCGVLWTGVDPSFSTQGGQCVGWTDGTVQLASDTDDAFDQVWDRIRDQNRTVDTDLADGSARPVMTLIYLSDLSAPVGTHEAATDKREELEGLAVAQRQTLQAPGSSDPLVKIVLANAGRGMVHGRELAQRLGALAHSDPTIVGVTGLSESRVATLDTIKALDEQRLPVVASTLSADVLADANPLFWQVAPQNRLEAAVAAAWAAHIRDARRPAPDGRPAASRAVIAYSIDPADIYSQNLADDLSAALTQKGFAPIREPYVPISTTGQPEALATAAPTADALGRRLIGFDGIVVFAGRGIPDFAGLLSGLERGPVPWVLGGDDVTRYIADAPLRRQQRAVPYSAISFSVAPEVDSAPEQQDVDFYQALRSLFDFETSDAGRSFDGHAALSYDAALVYIRADDLVRDQTKTRTPEPETVAAKIADIQEPPGADRPLLGSSGPIDYAGGSRAPRDKAVSILRVVGGEVRPELTATCGESAAPAVPIPWCPARNSE